MITAPASWLLLAGASPLFAAILTMVAMRWDRHSLGLIATWLGIGAMLLASSIATILLANLHGSGGVAIELPIWTWLSLDTPQSPSITFGIDATAAKVGGIGVVSLVALAMMGVQFRRSKSVFSLDAMVATNLACVGAISFLLAPNLAQALLGWAVGSLSLAVLIRRSHVGDISAPPSTVDRSQALRASPQGRAGDLNGHRRVRQLSSFVSVSEQKFCDLLWIPITCTFPRWVGEQIEILEHGPVSIQLLASTLGAIAILLTWLIGS